MRAVREPIPLACVLLLGCIGTESGNPLEPDAGGFFSDAGVFPGDASVPPGDAGAAGDASISCPRNAGRCVAGEPRRVAAVRAAVQWAGATERAVVWIEEGGALLFQGLEDGRLVAGAPIRLAERGVVAADVTDVRIPGGVGVVWLEAGPPERVWYARVDGDRVDARMVRLGDGSYGAPRVASGRAATALVVPTSLGIRFIDIATDREVPLPGTGGASSLDLGSEGSLWWLAWVREGEAQVARLGEDGTFIAPARGLGAGERVAMAPLGAGDGSERLVAVADGSNVALQRVGAGVMQSIERLAGVLLGVEPTEDGAALLWGPPGACRPFVRRYSQLGVVLRTTSVIAGSNRSLWLGHDALVLEASDTELEAQFVCP